MRTHVPPPEGESRFRRFLRRLLPRGVTQFWLDLLQSAGPLLILSAIAVFAALHYVRPAPPDRITIASGPPGSKFNTVAQQYQTILKRNGITLRLIASEGSSDNLQRLIDPHSGVDVALVQSGTPATGDTSDLRSLGTIFYETLTIFYRAPKPIARLSQLRGQRIAIGPAGSGTHSLALALLKANGIEEHADTTLLDLEGEAARTALLAKQVDAIFLAGDSAAPATIREMLHAPGILLFDFPQADAYVRRFHYLNKLEMPAGSFDLGENLPAMPVSLLAPTVELLARSELHPALSDLLLEAATEVHGGASLLQNAGQFPNPSVNDYPISTDAARYFKSGKSFAYRYLPFWLASLLDRALVVFLPVVLVVIPALRYIPALYNWRINRRINRRYGQLMAVERQSLGDLTPQKRAALLEQLAHIEKSVIALRMPGSHADQLYVLRQHMQFVRENLARASPTAGEPTSTTPDGAPAVKNIAAAAG
jgi:TRAP transporter TAXI family solute receptor